MTEEENYIVEIAKGVLETLLSGMGITASVVSHTQPSTSDEEGDTVPVTFDIRGDDLGILIGRRGQTLSSLQYMVRIITTHQTKSPAPITIDVEGYKQRRYQSLQALAWRIAEQVKVKKVPFGLEPMSAYERRIIHLALADHPDVTTESTGEGLVRKVVISLKEQ